MVSLEDYESEDPIAWCPGCGNFSLLSALKEALVDLGKKPNEIVIVSGIGQASKTPHYLMCNAFNGLHGRTLPVATGLKLANHELTVLAEGGMDPTMVIGGRLNSLGSNARLGGGDFLVAEADESDGSFLMLSPTVAVVTNIDPEHLDHYKDMQNLKEAFLRFVGKVPFYGLVVLCMDHPNVCGLLPQVRKRHATYGLSRQADFRAQDIRREGWETRFRVVRQEEDLGEIRLRMPGLHNVSNALAAVVVGHELDLDFSVVKQGLENFEGIQRRLEIKGKQGGIVVVDDYAHHPAEIRATLDAVRRGWDKRILAVFQPHRYTRTQLCFEDFLGAFHDADSVIVADIYAAGEKELMGVHAKRLAEGIRRQGHKEVHYIQGFPEIVSHLSEVCHEGDMVLTLGAGDVYRVGEMLLEDLKNRG